MHLCLLILGNKGRVLYFFFAIVILHRKIFCVQNLAIYTTFTYFSKSPCILQWLEFWRPNIQNCKSSRGCHWFITSHCWKVTCGRNNYYASDCLNRHSRNSFESTLFWKFRQTTLHCTLCSCILRENGFLTDYELMHNAIDDKILVWMISKNVLTLQCENCITLMISWFWCKNSVKSILFLWDDTASCFHEIFSCHALLCSNITISTNFREINSQYVWLDSLTEFLQKKSVGK